MSVRIETSKPRHGGVSEVTLVDGDFRITATVTDSMLGSELADSFLQSIMDAERRRIERAREAVGTGGDA